jgi:hypothetical protein
MGKGRPHFIRASISRADVHESFVIDVCARRANGAAAIEKNRTYPGARASNLRRINPAPLSRKFPVKSADIYVEGLIGKRA